MEAATSYLPSWLERAMRAPGPIRLEFRDSGSLSIFPSQGRYTSDIQDWAVPSLLEEDAPTITPLPTEPPTAQGQPLLELHWTLMLQRLAQLNRAPQDYPFQFSLIRLVSWPSLPHLPQEVLVPVARLCALLARKPTAASLLPLLLELPESQVFMLVEALRQYGHVQVSGAPASEAPADPPGRPADAPPAAQSTAPSLITKIWQRLVARN